FTPRVFISVSKKPFTAISSQFSSLFGFPLQHHDVMKECANITWLMKQAGLAMQHNFAQTSGAGGENRFGKIVGFVDNESQRFKTNRRRDDRAHSTEEALFFVFWN